MPPFHWWRTVFFLIPAITLYTIVLGTISVLSSAFDNGYFAHRCARIWSRLILLTTGVTVSVAGLERLDPNGTYVFVSNHQSIYDIPVLFWSLPQQLRIIAKESLGRFPFIGWHLRRTGHLLVDRGRPDRNKLFAWARRLTEHRLSLFFFPEGTRSRDGRVGPFKTGSFYLALEAGLTIVPLSIVGSRHVMMKGRLAAYPRQVRLVVHVPLETTGFTGRDRREFAERVRQIIAPTAESDLDVMPPDTHSDASRRDEVVRDAQRVARHS